jgi:DNA-binding NarL/FixJ family response regulator
VVVAVGPTLFREALSQALATGHHIRVAGTAGTEDAVAALLVQQAPQVVLLDYEAFGPNAEGMVSRLRRQSPGSRVLVLASRSGPDTAERVLEAGAAGVVGKMSDLDTLGRAIVAVADGEVWADPHVTARALEQLAGPASSGRLTGREAGIVRLVSHGLRNKEIAQRLGINEKTVKSHLNNIFRKLRVDSRVALALLDTRAIQPKT